MSDIEFHVEQASLIWDDLLPLLDAHEREMCIPGGMSVDLDIEQINVLEEHGLLKLFTMSSAGSIVGYAAFVISQSLMFRGKKQAAPLGMFLTKEYRRGAVGCQFIAWCDEQLRGMCVSLVYQSVGRTDYSNVLMRLGYEFCESTYVRVL